MNGWAGHSQTAIGQLQRVLKISPKRRYDVLRPLGWQFINNKEPNQAIPLFKEYLTKHPKDRDATIGLHAAYLAKARQHNDKKEFAKALAIYHQLLAKHPNNTDLLIETARVYGWNEQYDEAIALYLQVLAIAPYRKYDVLIPLGWQYLWNNNSKEAILLFEEYLMAYPGTVDAMLGLAHAFEANNNLKEALLFYNWVLVKDFENLNARYGSARVLSYLNRFNAAIQSYKAILHFKPNDTAALAGIAQTHNWENLTRLAASEYQELVNNGVTDTYVKVGLAQAQRWSGFPDLALKTLAGVPGQDAEEVRARAKFEAGNPLGVIYEQSSDSDGLVTSSYSAYGGFHLTNTLILSGIYRLANFREQGERILDHDYWITLANRFGNIDSFTGTHWADIALGSRTYGNWQTTAWSVNDKWIPADIWRIYFNSGNEVIENIPSIQNRVVYTRANLGFDFLPIPRFQLAMLGQAGSFSDKFDDSNNRYRVGGRMEYLLFYNPRIFLFADGYYFTDTNPDIYVGYYNPGNYREARESIGLIQPIGNNWDFGFRGGIGRYEENPGGPGDLNYYILTVSRDFHRYGRLNILYQKSRSAPGLSSGTAGTGYLREYFAVNYNTSF